ncbi:MAG: hypothetical protein ACRYG7_13100 [Janthinobacterium lividum]
MLANATVVFAQAAPELLAACIKALKTHPQRPFGRPAYASGRTAAQMAEEHGADFMQVTGPQHLQTLITGRGPTKGAGEGGDKLSEILAQWARDKPGFTLREGSTYEKFGIAAAIKMHREGSALYQLGQPSGLFDNVLSADYIATLNARIAAGEMTAITTALTYALGS